MNQAQPKSSSLPKPPPAGGCGHVLRKSALTMLLATMVAMVSAAAFAPTAAATPTTPDLQAVLRFVNHPCRAVAIGSQTALTSAGCAARQGSILLADSRGRIYPVFQKEAAPWRTRNGITVEGFDIAVLKLATPFSGTPLQLLPAHEAALNLIHQQAGRFVSPREGFGEGLWGVSEDSQGQLISKALPFRQGLGWWGREVVLGSEARHLCDQDMGGPLIARLFGKFLVVGIASRPLLEDDQKCQHTADVFTLVTNLSIYNFIDYNRSKQITGH